MSKNINNLNIDDILLKASEAKNKKICDLIKVQDLKMNDKGKIGNLIQRDYFGIPINNKKEPDFISANLELKVTPVKKKNKNYSAKERLKISSLNWENVSNNEFEYSDVYKKLKKMLILNYLHENENESFLDNKIINTYLFDFNELSCEDKMIIKNDYDIIRKKINDNYPETLSESDTLILSASRSGQGKGKDLQTFLNTDKKINRRAFALKQNFMTKMFNLTFSNLNADDFIFNEKKIFKTSPQETIMEKIDQILNPFKNINIIDNYNDNSIIPKAANNIFFKNVIRKSNEKVFSGLEYLGFKFRCVTVSENNKIKEHFPSSTINNIEITKTNFEDSKEYTKFIAQKYIFIKFKRKDKKHIYCDGWFDFYISENDKEIFDNFKFVWEDTKNKFINGVQEKIKIDKSGKTKIGLNFIGVKDKKMFHIRPKAKNGEDKYLIGNNKKIVKQGFWINKSLLQKFLNAKIDKNII